MKLLPREVREVLPKLYAQEFKGENAVVFIKFFDPCSNWTWYVTEYDGVDTFFGLVDGHFVEWGYFSLVELEKYKGPTGLGVERDLYFIPRTAKELTIEKRFNGG